MINNSIKERLGLRGSVPQHNISALFDSVYTINECKQAVASVENGENRLQEIAEKLECIERNVMHIKYCLDQESYKTNLTQEQKDQLNACLSDAETFVNTTISSNT